MAIVRIAVFIALTGCLTGCGQVRQAAELTRAQNAVKALSIDFMQYQSANAGNPPASADQLAKFNAARQDAAMLPGELEKLQVQWGAIIDPHAAGARVLASHKPIGGKVVVLLQDGRVNVVSEAEFAAAPKAETVKKP